MRWSANKLDTRPNRTRAHYYRMYEYHFFNHAIHLSVSPSVPELLHEGLHVSQTRRRLSLSSSLVASLISLTPQISRATVDEPFSQSKVGGLIVGMLVSRLDGGYQIFAPEVSTPTPVFTHRRVWRSGD